MGRNGSRSRGWLVVVAVVVVVATIIIKKNKNSSRGCCSRTVVVAHNYMQLHIPVACVYVWDIIFPWHNFITIRLPIRLSRT